MASKIEKRIRPDTTERDARAGALWLRNKREGLGLTKRDLMRRFGLTDRALNQIIATVESK